MMQFKLNSANTTINKIGLGTGTGFVFKNKKHDSEIISLINSAVELGVNFFDTAEAYFDGHSEELLGKALRGKRKKVIIASKFSPENSTKKFLIKAIDGSLSRLKSDYIDLYQVHWPNLSVPLEETLGVLEREVKKGKIKYIGVCNFLPKQIIKTRKILKNYPLTSIQNEYNLFERGVEKKILPICQKNNIAFIAYSPLGPHWPYQNKYLSKTLTVIANKYNKTPHQIVLNWLGSNRNVITIPATTSLNHLKENSLSNNFVMDKRDISIINRRFFYNVYQVDVNKIFIPKKLNTYLTIENAVKNLLNFSPSPSELATEIRDAGGFLKPIKLKKRERKTFELIDGKIRFWAWVIAYDGKKSIPAIID